MPRLIRPVLAGVAAVALGACGGGTGAPGGSGTPASSELVSADVAAFVAIDGNFDSEQWSAVEELVARFPGGADTLGSLFSELAEGSVDFEADLLPALGPDVAIALADLPPEGDPPAVLLTQPADPAKLEALLAEADEPPVWRIVEGWYVVAKDDATIDRTLADGHSLAGAAAFTTAMNGLPHDALARVYLDGPALTEAAQASSQGAAGVPALGVEEGMLTSVAFAVSAEADGFRVDGVARSEGAPQLEAAPSALLDLVPADALAFGAVHGLDDGLSQLLDAAEDSAELDQAAALLGLSLGEDVLPLFAGESGLYVRGGTPVPEVTLMLSPDDPERALETVDRLLAAVSAFGAGGSQDGEGWTPYPPPGASTVTLAGVEVKQFPLGEDLVLSYGVVEGRLVLSTSEAGIADLVGDGPRLSDDPAFQEASEAASLPGETLGLLYVDLREGIGLLETLGALEGAEPDTLANLRPLRSLLVHATGSGEETRFAGFLAIE